MIVYRVALFLPVLHQPLLVSISTHILRPQQVISAYVRRYPPLVKPYRYQYSI